MAGSLRSCGAHTRAPQDARLSNRADCSAGSGVKFGGPTGTGVPGFRV